MARVTIEMPEFFPFETVLEVRVSELNYGNHLGNDRVLALVHEARMRFFQHYGLKEYDIDDISFLQADCAVVYKSEAFWGDRLRIKVAAGDYTRVAVDFYFRIENAETGKVVAEAKTGLVCFDFKNRKIHSLPTVLKETFGDAFHPIKEENPA